MNKPLNVTFVSMKVTQHSRRQRTKLNMRQIMKCKNRTKLLITSPIFVVCLFFYVNNIGAETWLRGSDVKTSERIGKGREALDCEHMDEELYRLELLRTGEEDAISLEKRKVFCKTANSRLHTMKGYQLDSELIEERIHEEGEEGITESEALPGVENRNNTVMPVSNDDIIEKLHFYVRTKSFPRGNRQNCGGCETLWDLYDEIKKRGAAVDAHELVMPGNFSCPTDEMLAEPIRQKKTIVFVYAETSVETCRGRGYRRHIRWILAPLGAVVEADRWKRWDQNDLVFSYSNMVAGRPDLPVSNILQILSSPEPGDNTDVTDAQFFDKEGRYGIMWMLRKAAPYRDILTYIHKYHRMSYWQNEKPVIPDDFLKREYFVTYDPYTYFTFAAAMVGTVSVVNPIEGFTKREWLRGTYVGEYMEATGTTVPGIAYGWNEEELDFARRTMYELRGYMYKVRAWGREETVPKFMRDCYRYAYGAEHTGQLEGGLLVSEAFGDDKIGPLQKFMESHKHDGRGHQNLVEDNDVTDDGWNYTEPDLLDSDSGDTTDPEFLENDSENTTDLGLLDSDSVNTTDPDLSDNDTGNNTDPSHWKSNSKKNTNPGVFYSGSENNTVPGLFDSDSENFIDDVILDSDSGNNEDEYGFTG